MRHYITIYTKVRNRHRGHANQQNDTQHNNAQQYCVFVHFLKFLLFCCVVMLSAVILAIIMRIVNMLTVIFRSFNNAECRFAECHFSGCCLSE